MKKVLQLLVLLLVVVSFGACDKSEPDFDTEIAAPVSVEEVKLASIEQFIIATGTVSSAKEVNLRAESRGGYLLQSNPETGKPFALGDRITAGQILVRLDNPEEENNIRIDSKQLHLETARLEFEKQRSLHEKGGVTWRELKDAERAYIDARYDVDNARFRLAKLAVKAPFAGILTELPYYTPATLVDSGKPIAQIMDYAALYLDVNLPGKDLGAVRPGQTVRISNYTLPDDVLDGEVSQVSPALDPQSRSFRATVAVANPDLLLRPGMFVKAEIITARRDSTVVIPKDILLAKRRGKTIFVVEKGAVDERVVTTGLENPEQIEILAGLDENERLVTSGFETLRNGAKVKVVR